MGLPMPRLPFLQNLRRKIAPTSDGLAFSVDQFDVAKISGWAQYPQAPEQAVGLTLLVDGQPETTLIATEPRPDVVQAGYARQRCGFTLSPHSALLDGKPHQVSLIVEKPDGTHDVLHSEELFIGQQGVSFFDPQARAIRGWATGARAVQIDCGDAQPVTIPLDKEVLGFHQHHQVGFRYDLTEAQMDGNWHTARVTYDGSEKELDGSPVQFRLPRHRPIVRKLEIIGTRARAVISDTNSRPKLVDIKVDIDDHTSYQLTSDGRPYIGAPLVPRKIGRIAFDIPAGSTRLAFWEETADGPVIIARYKLEGQTASPAPLLPSEPGPTVQALLADPAERAAVNAAFDTFCTTGGAPFDPIWYCLNYPDAAHEIEAGTYASAIAHYAAVGAAAGYAPHGLFDELAVRELYPAVNAAIAQDLIPCAFALYHYNTKASGLLPLPSVAFEEFLDAVDAPSDALDPMQTALTALSKAPRLALDSPVRRTGAAVPARLPAPTSRRDQTTCIYAAWMERLQASDKAKTALDIQEGQMRDYINAIHLGRTPLVSIIMPTFNRAFAIGEAIQSALDQSYSNWELLICDDGSFDKTSEVIKQFNDPRIRYMQFTKSNGAETRNKGLSFARGEYIAYLDSDNLWNPHFLDLMLRKLMENPGTQIAYTGYIDTEIIGSTVKLLDTPSPDFNPIKLSSRNFMDLNSIVHHRQVYDWMGGFDKTLPRLQDWDLMLRYTSIFRPKFVNFRTVFYRRNVAWGQVTNLFIGGGTQNTVNQKTQDRLHKAHARLEIPYPSPPRVLILSDDTDQNAQLAHCFATCAAETAKVEFLSLSDMPFPLSPNINIHRLPPALTARPDRLRYLLSNLRAGDTLVNFGFGDAVLRRLVGPADQNVFTCKTTKQGLFLIGFADANLQYYLGTLPIALPDVPRREANPAPIVTLLPGQTSRPEELEELSRLSEALEMTCLLPPGGSDPVAWSVLQNGEHRTLGGDWNSGLSHALQASDLMISKVQAADMTPFDFALLSAFQGRGIAPVLPPKGIGDIWQKSRCAYPIEVDTWSWVLDKVKKLHRSGKDLQKLSDNAQTAFKIMHHPELVQERINFFLYETNFGTTEPEVSYASQ